MNYLVYVNKPCQTLDNKGVKIDNALHKSVLHTLQTETHPKLVEHKPKTEVHPKQVEHKKIKQPIRVSEDLQPQVLALQNQCDVLYSRTLELEHELASTHEFKETLEAELAHAHEYRENAEKINSKLNKSLMSTTTKSNEVHQALHNENTKLKQHISAIQEEHAVKHAELQQDISDLKNQSTTLHQSASQHHNASLHELQSDKLKLQKYVISLEDSVTKYRSNEQGLASIKKALEVRTEAVQNAHDLIATCALREQKSGNKKMAEILHESKELLSALLN